MEKLREPIYDEKANKSSLQLEKFLKVKKRNDVHQTW